jgi:Uma2 family endonuclease
MATVPSEAVPWKNGYPTSDGKPMAETDQHRDLMNALIETLKVHYAARPRVYVSGNLLLFYRPGDRRRHVSPDVFVVKGVAKHDRPNYLLWEEKKGPDVVIELTSSSTRREDLRDKFQLYRDTLQVPEYFLFDPLGDYLDPPMQGYRLREGEYHLIRPYRGRLPSKALGLHLERHGKELRLYDPASARWLPTPLEMAARAQAERGRIEAERDEERTARRQAEAELERLRQELERLRRQPPPSR